MQPIGSYSTVEGWKTDAIQTGRDLSDIISKIKTSSPGNEVGNVGSRLLFVLAVGVTIGAIVYYGGSLIQEVQRYISNIK